MKTRGFCLGLLSAGLVLAGTESYSELMARAEKLTEQRYAPTSRAFKIKSAELDAILDSQETREEKILRLREFIRNLETLNRKDAAAPQNTPSSAGARETRDPLQSLKKKAEKGDPEPLYRLGMAYWEGRQTPRSLSRALRCFHRAAAGRHAPSRFMLAIADMNGKGVIPDRKKAFARFRELYDEGFSAAGIPLGILYYEGHGTDRNYRMAAECLQKGLPEKKQVPGKFSPEAVLGRIYYHGGYGIKPDFGLAVKYLKRADPDPETLFLLGGLYRDGKGTVRNLPAAAECFLRAAEHGHRNAGAALGRMYHQGDGVKKDDLQAVLHLTPAADQGDVEAALLLAKIHADQKSPAFHEAKALQYCRIPARKGNPDALYQCGFMILNGIGSEKDPSAALQYLVPAARQGHAGAAFLCGEIERMAKRLELSAAYYRMAADRDHPESIRRFAGMALAGQGMKADPELGIRYWEKLAVKEDVLALEQLAALYESGIGNVKADVRKAIHYYTRAAAKGSVPAQTRLGLLYEALGDNDKALQYAEAAARQKNPEAVLLLARLRKDRTNDRNQADETLQHLRNLADSGDRKAMRQLGSLLYRRNDPAGAEKYLKTFEEDHDPEILFLLGEIACRRPDGKADYGRAFQLLNRAAEAGHGKALIRLGRMYHRGEGVRQDFRRALICYRRAADRKDPEGMYLTGSMFYNGEGVSPDYAEAYRWFRQAAENGNILAMQYLSIMYKEGIGVPKNNPEAVKWRRKASGARP